MQVSRLVRMREGGERTGGGRGSRERVPGVARREVGEKWRGRERDIERERERERKDIILISFFFLTHAVMEWVVLEHSSVSMLSWSD